MIRLRYYLLVIPLVFIGCKEDIIEKDQGLSKPSGLKIENITSDGFEINWNRAQNATQYIVDVALDNEFENFVDSYEQVQTAVTKLAVEGFEETTTYYVRVQATDGFITTDFSDVETATTYFGGEDIAITTSDGLVLKATLRIHEDRDDQPLVVFCHSVGSSESEWLSDILIEKVFEAGYGVLTFDNRSHGKSDDDPDAPRNNLRSLLSDPEGIPVDLAAVYDYILNNDKVNHERLGIIGSSMGGNLACFAMGNTAFNFKIAVSLSPSAQRVSDLSTYISPFEMSGIYYLAADGDSDRVSQSLDLFDITATPNKISIAQGTDAHGSEIIRNLIGYRGEVYNWILEQL